MAFLKEDATLEQQATWDEILKVCLVEEAEEQEGGLVCLLLHEDDAHTVGIYSCLWINREGRVAEAMVSNPYYYEEFSQLLTAAHTRTAAS